MPILLHPHIYHLQVKLDTFRTTVNAFEMKLNFMQFEASAFRLQLLSKKVWNNLLSKKNV